MTMALEIAGEQGAILGTITALQQMIGVSQVFQGAGGPGKARVLVTLQKPRICQASYGSGVVCSDCPFDSAEVPSRWRFSLRRTGDTGQIVATLTDETMQASTDSISAVDRNVQLTPRERGIVAVAIERGYFDFPRRITLEGLSGLVGVDAASLRKIFHSLE